MRKFFKSLTAFGFMFAFLLPGLMVPALAEDVDVTAKFTDANFRAAVYQVINKSPGASIYSTDLAYILLIDVSGNEIRNLAGIEYFTSLIFLICNDNQISVLNISKNTALTTLDCGNNQLKSLDVSNNTALETLNCANNQLGMLDVSQNTLLKTLNCAGNQLSGLDIGPNLALVKLDCSDNRLAMLDVSQNLALRELNCSNNHMAKKPTGIENLNLRFEVFDPQDVAPAGNRWVFYLIIGGAALLAAGGIVMSIVAFRKKAYRARISRLMFNWAGSDEDFDMAPTVEIDRVSVLKRNKKPKTESDPDLKPDEVTKSKPKPKPEKEHLDEEKVESELELAGDAATQTVN